MSELIATVHTYPFTSLAVFFAIAMWLQQVTDIRIRHCYEGIPSRKEEEDE